MIPILFPASATKYTTQGLGALTDAISCVVREERNGAYELEMQYSLDGIHFSEITDRCIIYAIPSPYRDPQPFRIYRITKPLNGIVTIYAQHISYDLSGIPLNPFTAASAPAAMAGLSSNSETDCPFTFWTDKSTKANFTVSVPSSIRSVLGGQEGSVLDVYGGEYEWDGFTVKLHNQRGQDNGVIIRYGKNLIDLEQDRNISNAATGIYPYWKDTEGNLVTCNPKIINAYGTYDFTRVVPVDFSQDFEEKPTPEQLQARAETYVKTNNIGVPKVSITASFVQLEQYEPYTNIALLEKCDLCDTVTVQFEKLGVDAKAEIVSIETDVLLERYNSVEIGEARSTISDTIISQQQEIQKLPTTTAVQQAVSNATAWLTNGEGYKVERRDAAGNAIDTLYMDTPDINTAQNILRIGQSGIGFSYTGVDGPYLTAWTLDGKFVADFITAGTINAALVKIVNLIVDHVLSQDSRFSLEIVSSKEKMFDNDYLRYGNFITSFAGESDDPLKSFGQINLYKGDVDRNGDYSPETATRAYMNPEGLGIANEKFTVDGAGKASAVTVSANNILSDDINPEKISLLNGSRTNLYWEEITLDDGRKTHVLCGWDEVQS